MRALLPVLAVLVSACNAPFQEPVDFPRHRPLEARIAPGDVSSRQVRFHLSRPAYAAVFEVIPGGGVSVLYPTPADADRRLRSGWHSPSGWARRGGWRDGFRTHYRPRYLYLVASERPLRVDRFARSPYALRQALGPNAFASHDPRRTMAMLDDLVLAGTFDQEWTSDVYVQWPEERRREELVAYRCSNGGVIHVPRTTRGSLQHLCAQYDPPKPAVDTVKSDTTTVRKPSRRRPEVRPEAEAPRRPATRPGTTPENRTGDREEGTRERLDRPRPRPRATPAAQEARPESRPTDAGALLPRDLGPRESPAPGPRGGAARPEAPTPEPAAPQRVQDPARVSAPSRP